MNDKIIVAGLGKSGISSAKLLLKAGGRVLLYDENENLNKEDIKDKFDIEYQDRIEMKFGSLTAQDVKGIKIAVISPGIPLEADFVQVLDKENIQIWSEIQLGFAVEKGKLISITGTNGKTTTTALVGEIMKAYAKESFTVGNIGIPYTDIALDTGEDSITVLETSSFQLETITDFKPNVSAILNITPDHLNRHHTMENYIRIKEDICMNQDENDFIVLNYDDPVLREFGLSGKIKPKVVFFSSTRILEEGYYLDDGIIYKKERIGSQKVLEVKDLNLLGKHNYENVMAAIAISVSIGVPLSTIQEVCKRFQAVEHRIEFVAEKNGVKYYNDSKGTNPDASIQAIRAMPGPILLIAGGYDKDADYHAFIDSFEDRVKYMVLIGQTRDKISACAKEHGFQNIMYAESMEEAVRVCTSYAMKGDYVLLSPACASWGMFKDYEERGRIFKDCVSNI